MTCWQSWPRWGSLGRDSGRNALGNMPFGEAVSFYDKRFTPTRPLVGGPARQLGAGWYGTVS